MPPLKEKETKEPELVEFYSKYRGLRILFKRPMGRPDGTTQPGVEVIFQNNCFSTKDPEIIDFLKTRTVNAVRTIGVDYWLREDMEKHIKRLPFDRQNDALLKSKDDKIAKLEAQLKAMQEKK